MRALRSSSSLTSVCESFLWAFSIITIHASTIAPIAMAMPPKLMMFDSNPKSFIHKKVKAMVSGRTMITTSALLKCSKKSITTAKTTMLSSKRARLRLLIAFVIRSLRSYVVTTSTSLTCNCESFSFTAWITLYAFSL